MFFDCYYHDVLIRDIYNEVRSLSNYKCSGFSSCVAILCLYDERRTRCKSHDTCQDIPIWLKNEVSSHSKIGHWLEVMCDPSTTSQQLLYPPPPPANFVWGGYTVFTLSVCPCVRPSVTFCFLDILKSHCWIFIKPCKHVHICKTNTLDKKVRARGQFY